MNEPTNHWYDLLNQLPTNVKILINSAMGMNALSMWLGIAETMVQGFILLGSAVLVWLQLLEMLDKRKKRLAAEKAEEVKKEKETE